MTKPSRIASSLAFGFLLLSLGALPVRSANDAPVPLLKKDGEAVDWWFVFKFNSQKTFAACASPSQRVCPFGGKPQTNGGFGQQFAFASSENAELKQGSGCVGATSTDPVGATFDQVYNGSFNYLIWNDQFYGDPVLTNCKGDSCGAPWGHSKGLLAWNDAGQGFVMQVTTPSWPGSGTRRIVRKAGNTLGCISSNNNVKASQHFFALKLTKADLVLVLKALQRAGVVTDPTQSQIVRNGGPADIKVLVEQLGERPKKLKPTQTDPENFYSRDVLSSKVILIAKTANLTAPPWQMVSAILDGSTERAATWWTTPRIYTTTKASKVNCLGAPIEGKPGPVAIAKSGTWDAKEIGLAAPLNHAKIGVATSGSHHYAIFGDLNQQGGLSRPNCGASQNGRGGLFFVIDNKTLADSVSDLLDGDTAPTKGPR